MPSRVAWAHTLSRGGDRSPLARSLHSRGGFGEGACVILGMGIDVVATERVARLLESDAGFEQRLFTALERDTCRLREDRAAALGARFAAKEACLKALGAGLGQGVSLADIEVVTLEGGRPELALSAAAGRRAADLGVTRIHVTLTHDTGVAAAVVVLEGEPVSPTA